MTTQNNSAKKAYQTPLMVVYGDVRDITRGGNQNNNPIDNTSAFNTF